jgi:cellulose synthase/poly-beta-1,6-N-acetylglucosamine synthase-like glycosyltransferase
MELKDPLISIILPVRNEEKYIAKCLLSIVNQNSISKDMSYEILVVDGMSIDKTQEIIKEFEQKYKNITLLENPKETVPHALNIGIKHAKGDVIVRVDGHTNIEKDYIYQCVKYLKKTKAECVGGVTVNVNGSFVGKAIALAMSSSFGVGNARFRTGGKEGFVDTLAFGAYRRDVFDKIGTFTEEFTRAQDEEFNYRLRKFGGNIYFTPKIKSYYCTRSSLRKLWSQYFQYGYWKIRVMQKHFKTMQLRQFVPATFVLSLISTGIFSMFSNFIFWFFLSIVLLYSTANLLATFKLVLKKRLKYVFILPSIFFTLHASYGFGFLWGLLKFSKFWITEKEESRKYSGKSCDTADMSQLKFPIT